MTDQTSREQSWQTIAEQKKDEANQIVADRTWQTRSGDIVQARSNENRSGRIDQT